MSTNAAQNLPSYDDPPWGRAEARLLFSERPAAAGSSNVLLVRIVAGSDGGAREVPAVVSVVVDTSGSMEGDALHQAREGCKRVAESLSSADEISVVDCGSRPRTVFPSRPVADRTHLREALARLRAGGGADLGNALHLALEQVSYRRDGPALRVVVVVSDGPPTGRLRTVEDFGPLLDAAVRAGASIVAVGVGAEYDVSLLGEMARRTGGWLVGAACPSEVSGALAAIGEAIASTRVGPASVTVRLLAGNDSTRCEEAVLGRILSALEPGGARELVLDISHEAREPGTYVVAEVLVEALDTRSAAGTPVTLAPLARFGDGAAERPDDLVVQARKALDQARTLASATGAMRAGKHAPSDHIAELEAVARCLVGLGRSAIAERVLNVVSGLASGRVADPNKALAPVVLDIAIGRSAPPGAKAVHQSGTDAPGEAETAST